MRQADEFEFPQELQPLVQRARRLEWLTVAYVATAAALLYVTMGTSQAMRTSFFEDIISVVPAIAFLVAGRISRWPPRPDFPYGFHGAVSIGYLTASLALIGMGVFLLGEAIIKLAFGERTTIGGVTLFGHTVWAGWPMLAALAYTGIPSVFLGRAKLKLAPQLHDKILFADAKMMKADWMAETATAVGVLGVGFGFWWADPVAAAVVSLEILKDGIENLGTAVSDLIDERPNRTDRSGPDDIPERLVRHIRELDWVEAAEVRLRENGHVFFGEVFVVPKSPDRIVERVEQAVRHAKALDWRIRDVTVTPVPRIPGNAADAP